MEFHVNWLVNEVEGDGQNYLDLLDFIENNNLATTENYEFVKSQMDVENFALYQATNICIKNTDWPGNNVKFWQSREADSKWRWITFDTDFGFSEVNHNTLTFALAETGNSWPNPAISTFLLRQLNKNQEFKYLFINVFADELNTLWKTSDINALIDKMKGDISSEIPRHYKRWGANANSWKNNVNGLYTFASQRPAVVRRFVQNYYNLSGTYNLSLDVSEAKQGTIKLNTIQPDTYPWSGIYFNTVPITLIAKPNRGYRFVRWEGDVQSTQDTISLTRKQSTFINAVFEKDESLAGVVFINEVFYTNAAVETPKDWIELYNSSNNSLNLSGWIVKDSDDDHQFELPQGTIISANNYLVVCNDEALFSSFYKIATNTVGDLSFGLSNRSDYIRLYDQQKILIDSLYYFNHSNDSANVFSYQRWTEDEQIKWNVIDGFGTPLTKNEKGTSTALPLQNFIPESDVVVYPNPFSDQMTISFQLEKRGNVSLSIISQNGTLIDQIEDATFEQGEHSVQWNIQKQIPQGVYILLIKTDTFVLSKKVIRILE